MKKSVVFSALCFGLLAAVPGCGKKKNGDSSSCQDCGKCKKGKCDKNKGCCGDRKARNGNGK